MILSSDEMVEATRYSWIRQPPFRNHGRTVVAVLCGYELVALVDESPFPPISEIVWWYRGLDLPLWRRSFGFAAGVGLMALLGHHLFIELVEDS